MIPLDIPTVVLALVALASLIALFVLVADSRRLAEMRCAQCSSRGDCLALLAEGGSAPPADCPNGSFFQKGS